MLILGLNAYHGDVAAAILRDGALVAAVEEERFRRIKHCAGFPAEAVRSCIAAAGVDPGDIDAFAVPRARRVHLLPKALFAVRHGAPRRLFGAHARNVTRLEGLAARLAETLGLAPDRVARRMHYVEHHAAHLASAFFPSPFDDAAVCAIDGFGDFVSTSTASGRGCTVDIRHRVFFPHSLGLVYLAVTQFLGFKHYGDEFKVMGLAPYGSPDLLTPLRRVVHLRPGGDFVLDLAFFRHWTGAVEMSWDDGEPRMGDVYTPALESLLGPARSPDEPIGPRHEAVAASLQALFEEASVHVLRGVAERTANRRLSLAGGCAMNSVANGRIRERLPFTDVYIQPAAADNGTALGAALHVAHTTFGAPRTPMTHGYWGPAYGDDAIARELDLHGREIDAACERQRIDDDEALCDWTAGRIAAAEVVGWFQGRMEWGARALGNRSILADPRRADMRDIINTRIKFRERFRPFAPSILEDAVDEYFVGAVPDPFMMQVYPVRPDKRTMIPAIVHVDGSGRLQTVSDRTNPLYARLIRAFAARTGVPLLLNTSFNENEPIVLRPSEALDCFLRTGMDALVLGHHVLRKRGAGGGLA